MVMKWEMGLFECLVMYSDIKYTSVYRVSFHFDFSVRRFLNVCYYASQHAFCIGWECRIMDLDFFSIVKDVRCGWETRLHLECHVIC